MDRFIVDVFAGVMVTLIGIVVVFVVKATLKSFILDMQKMFVSIPMCQLQHKADADERESMRKDVQNHENRLNSVGA